MDVGMLQIGSQAARRALTAGPSLGGRALYERREPQGEPLLADAGRAPEQQGLGDPPRLGGPGETGLQLLVADQRTETQDRPRSQRTGSTCRGLPSRPGS